MRGNSLSRPLLLLSRPLRRLITSPSSSSSFPPLTKRFKIPKMDAAKSSHFRTISSQSSAKVDKFQQVFHSHPSGKSPSPSSLLNLFFAILFMGFQENPLKLKNQDGFFIIIILYSGGGWQKCWKEGLTPWDLRQPTPVLLHLHKTGALPKGRALVPGCGNGYDVVAIAGPERYVVGIDMSETAIEKALELSSSSNGEYFEFLKADFFAWCPTELFDFIFDYTFFCALEPGMRSSWAVKMRDILKPDGELMTLMFPVSDHKGGPPYKVSVADYEEVLRPVGFEAMSIEENVLAVAPRKGAEKLARWKRSFCQSSL